MKPSQLSSAALLQAVGDELGVRALRAQSVSGGDINDAYCVELRGGERVFVKTHASPPDGMFTAEARGIRWLAEADAITIPRVLGYRDDGPVRFLALEYIAGALRLESYDDQLGRGLAALHRYGAPAFGLDHSNFIGTLRQGNESVDSWAEFYQRRRLEPQLALAEKNGLAPREMIDGFEQLFGRLDDVVGPPEPPARLHGDLWGGNQHTDANGSPCLIDPACYGGHREMDLAMMRLFGGFSGACFSAYEEAFPLSAGAEQRVMLCQLYPLMVHLNLFGSSYQNGVMNILGSYC
ncbi:MAG: fructosamine kinase family protein [Polyangiaceae bacterium]|nr:fructosamine kinase family protein [Polyangiaceae bacterium]